MARCHHDVMMSTPRMSTFTLSHVPAGKDADKANQAESILKRYQDLADQPNARRQMIQEFWKQGGGKGKGLQCLHKQAFTYTENQDDKSWDGYITHAKLAEIHGVPHAWDLQT